MRSSGCGVRSRSTPLRDTRTRRRPDVLPLVGPVRPMRVVWSEDGDMTRPPILAGLTIITLFAVGVVIDSEPDLIEIDAAAPPPRVQPRPVTVATVEPEPGDSPTLGAPVAVVTTPATRGTQAQATPTVPPTASAPAPVDGNCASWWLLLDRYGIPYVEAHPIMVRESRCAMAHNGNAATGDDSWGPLQVNRYGSLAAWWDEGGYTAEVMATPEGSIAAAAVLYHACGWGPWTKPYGCWGDYQATARPRWGEW